MDGGMSACTVTFPMTIWISCRAGAELAACSSALSGCDEDGVAASDDEESGSGPCALDGGRAEGSREAGLAVIRGEAANGPRSNTCRVICSIRVAGIPAEDCVLDGCGNSRTLPEWLSLEPGDSGALMMLAFAADSSSGEKDCR